MQVSYIGITPNSQGFQHPVHGRERAIRKRVKREKEGGETDGCGDIYITILWIGGGCLPNGMGYFFGDASIWISRMC